MDKNKTPKLNILLSTYNGSKFINRQVDSIIHESFFKWRLIVRDDGSNDSTKAILKKYSEKDLRIIMIEDNFGNLGPCQSYSKLFEKASGDYIMFCDQDDVWFPKKIEKMLACMKEAEKKYPQKPLLIVSDSVVTDISLNPVHNSLWKYQCINPETGKRFESLLVQNIFLGCSMLFNKKLKDIIGTIPEHAVMHDWWVALVAAAFGKIIIIKKPLTRYRQHGLNTIGASKISIIGSTFKILSGNKTALKNLRGFDLIIKNSIEFKNHFSSRLTKNQIDILNSLINSSLPGIIRHRIYRQPFKTNLALLAMLIYYKLFKDRTIHEKQKPN